jgi:hypothetical protein
VKRILLLFAVINLAQAVMAQENPVIEKSGFELLADSTYSGYKDKGGLGGPTSIEAQLETC